MESKKKETPKDEKPVVTPNDNTPHKAPEGPSDAEKKELVHKALKEKRIKLDDGGAVPAAPALPADAPQESKLQAIWDALKMAGSQAVAPLKPLLAPAQAAGALAANPDVQNAAGSVVNTLASSLGAKDPIIPPVAVPPAAAAPVPPAVPPAPATAPTAAPQVAAGSPTPDPLAQLGKFDPSTVAPGMNADDRQALANQGIANQHTFGNYVAEALGGIGDALAAKGGVQQNSLGSIMGMQKQQRDEALNNFDQARDIAVQNHTMKNQADQDLINNVKAKGEMIVSPQIAQSLGHPEWANKPTAQVALALSAQKNMLDYTNNLMQRKQGALKDSADAVDQALKTGGIGGTQKAIDPQSRLRMITSNAIQNDPEAFGYSVSKAGN